MKISSLILFILVSITLFSQEKEPQFQIIEDDSLQQKSKSNSGLDTIITYSAQDTIVFDIKSKKMRMNGKSVLDFKTQNLKSEKIIIDFEDDLLEAEGDLDSLGNLFGFPIFKEKGEEYVGEKIKYNYKTNKGLIEQGETELDEGFYYGNQIKRVSETEFFIKKGYYTPCNEDDPSLYFGSSKMKMIAQDKIMLDPLVVYLQDMPVFIYPFGLFFSTKSGRRSGLVVPSFDVSDARGVVFQDFGFYWAASDIWDTQILGDYFTKGGYLVKNNTNIKYQDRFNANLDLQYGQTRQNPDDPFETAYSVRSNANLQISPNQKITTNLNFTTQDFNQRTTSNLNDRIQQDIVSNASYSVNFGQWGNISTAFRRNQSIIDGTYVQTPSLNYSLPNKKLFRIGDQDMILSYGLSANMQETKSISYDERFIGDSSLIDTNFNIRSTGSIRHTPSLSINLPKLWQFRIQPQIRGGVNHYLRRTERLYFAENDSVAELDRRGFFSEYYYSGGVNVATRFYGVSQPDIWGIKAIRHTVEPTVNYSFTPDFSGENFGFYGSYIDSSGRENVYSYFSKDGGGIAPSRQTQNLSYAVNQKWEMKFSQSDSLEPENLELLNIRYNGAYNIEADSFRFTDPRVSFTTPALKFINFSGNAGLSYYDQIREFDTDVNGDEVFNGYRVIDQTRFSNRKFPVRLTNLRLSLSTSISDQGISLSQDQIAQDNLFGRDSTGQMENDLGGRFLRRMNRQEELFDRFGDSSPGFNPISIPWNLTLGLNYTLLNTNPDDPTERINMNANLNFTLANTWLFRLGAQYDFINKELSTPTVAITKDLKCWEMSFNWTPTGPHRRFYFRIGLKASQLRDLQYEKRTSAIY